MTSRSKLPVSCLSLYARPQRHPRPSLSGGLHTNSRSIPLNALTPGSNYSCQIRAIGGSTGHSDWSNAVSHMSM